MAIIFLKSSCLSTFKFKSATIFALKMNIVVFQKHFGNVRNMCVRQGQNAEFCNNYSTTRNKKKIYLCLINTEIEKNTMKHQPKILLNKLSQNSSHFQQQNSLAFLAPFSTILHGIENHQFTHLHLADKHNRFIKMSAGWQRQYSTLCEFNENWLRKHENETNRKSLLKIKSGNIITFPYRESHRSNIDNFLIRHCTTDCSSNSKLVKVKLCNVEKKKKLRKLVPGLCPCIEPKPILDVDPLKRLPKLTIAEPPRICVEEICPPRADDGLQIRPKILPKLESCLCPCIEPPPLKPAPPLKRLPKVNVPEPAKVCPCEGEECCPPRADANLKIQPKKLPKLKTCDCPCIEPAPLQDAPPIKRLKKVDIPQPPRICPEEVCPDRADAKLRIVPKQLPRLEPSLCPCIEPPVMKPAPPLKRLVKAKIPEPPRVCPCEGEECCPPRADDNLKLQPKKLPKLEIRECPCIEPEPLKDVPPLKRLKKVDIPEPPRICVEEICPPRADDELQIRPKVLPKLEPCLCPCIEPPPLKSASPLKRLPKVNVPEPAKVCPCEGEECCPPRADANLKIQPKKLPKLKTCDCPCIEPAPLQDAPPIKRLKKVDIPQPPRICPEEVCPDRADAKLRIVPKQLPRLEPSLCPCIEPPVMKPAPPLKRLAKAKIPEPPRVCPCEGEECCPPRADDNLKLQPKKLPKLEIRECPCIEPEPLKDVPPLKRLKKVDIPEPPRVCVEEICPPRADDELQIRPKVLPKLEPCLCPCIEPPPLKSAPPLKRLPKVNVPEPAKVCPCEGEECCPPRADANLKIQPKKLPKLKTCDCPCIEPAPLQDAPPIKRLKKVDIPQPPRICPEEVCPDRADAKLRIVPKQLPRLEPSLCPCIEPPVMKPAPPLKRLAKAKILEPPRVCPCEDEECCPPRADKDCWLFVFHESKSDKDKKCYSTVTNAIIIPYVNRMPVKIIDGAVYKNSMGKHMILKNFCSFKRWSHVQTSDFMKKCYSQYYGDESYFKFNKYKSYNAKNLRRMSNKTKSLVKKLVVIPVTQTPAFIENCQKRNNEVKEERKSPFPANSELPLLLDSERKLLQISLMKFQNFWEGNKIDYIYFRGSKESYPILCKKIGTRKILNVSNGYDEQINQINYSFGFVCLPSKWKIILGIFCLSNRSISTSSNLDRNEDKSDGERFLSTFENLGQSTGKNFKYIEKNNTLAPVQADFFNADVVSKTIMVRTHTTKCPSGKCPPCQPPNSCPSLGSTDSTENCESAEKKKCPKINSCKQLSLWEKIVAYFKARPNCPTPEELEYRRLLEEAQKAADKIGLCLYDPRKRQSCLPKVISAKCKSESADSSH